MSDSHFINPYKEKAASYCAFQERCSMDVRKKLKEWDVSGNETEQIISELISEGFLNEERYAKAFARGKFTINHWGRRKIKYELSLRNISPVCIQNGLAEIEEDGYLQILEELFEKKWNAVKESNRFQKQKKIGSYLAGKGFESHLIQDLFKQKK